MALAGLGHLVFLRPFPDYYDFVVQNREEISAGIPLFDIVYGPVCRWPKLDVHLDYDQVSFHSPASIAALGQALPALRPNLRAKLRKV
jgi:hypothetical protein